MICISEDKVGTRTQTGHREARIVGNLTILEIQGVRSRPYTFLYKLLLAVRPYKGKEHNYKILTSISVSVSTSTSTSIYKSERGEHEEDARIL